MSFQLNDSSDDLISTPSTPLFPPMPTSNEDREIENLQKQIDDMNKYLLTVQLHAEDRQQGYLNKIQKLQQAIADEQEKASQNLERQISEQNAELKALYDKQAEELDEIKSGVRRMTIDTENWNVLSSNLNDLGEQIEEIDLHKRINQVQGEREELQIIRKNKYDDARMKMQMILKTQENQIKQIQDEIERYRTALRQDLQHFELMSRECTQAQEKREKTHNIVLDKINYEAKQREDIFESRLISLQRQIEKEKQKTDTDLKSLRDTEDSLLQMKRKTSQSCMQQFSEATRDIQRIQRLLEKSNEAEESNQLKTLSARTKTQGLQKQNVILKQQVDQMQTQIDNMEVSIQKGSAELKRALTPIKPPGSYRRSRGIFY